MIPTAGDVHVNAPLTNILIAYLQKDAAFVADKVFPRVPVLKQSDRYITYDKSEWFRDEAEERAPGAETAGGGWSIDNTPTYYSRVYGIHKDVDDQIRANATAPINMDRDATNYVAQKLLLKREKVWLDSYFKTGIWTTDLDGSGADFVQWSDAAAAPIRNIDDNKNLVAGLTGLEPNVMVVSPDVFTALKSSPDVLNRIRYTQRGLVTEDLLATMFGVDKFLVPRGVENIAAQGAAENTSFLTSDQVLLVYAAPNPGIYVPSGGYTFAWTGYAGAEAYGARMKRFRIEKLASDRVEGEMAFDCKLVSAELGVFFTDVI